MNTSKKLTSLNNSEHIKRYKYAHLSNRLCVEMKKTKAISNIGIWQDGYCSWLNEAEWDFHPPYYVKDGLTVSVAYHLSSNLHITTLDQVTDDGMRLLRKLFVKNQSDFSRDVRIVFHQRSLTEPGKEQVTFYSPSSKALLHYGDGRYTLVSGKFGSDSQCQFAAGDPKGTWNEKSGTLSLLPIADQTLESMFTVRLRLNPWEEQHGRMWMLHHHSLEELQDSHQTLLTEHYF